MPLQMKQLSARSIKSSFRASDLQNVVQVDLIDQVPKNEELKQVEEQVIVAGKNEKSNKYTFFVYGGNYPETVSEALMRRGNWTEGKEEDNLEKCAFVWRPFNYPIEGYKRIDKRMVRNNQILIYNHFEVLKGLTTKSGLVRSLKQYYYNNEAARTAGYSIFDSTPTTFLLASGVPDDAEWTEFMARYRDFQRGYAPKERIPIKHCVNNIWLVKPANANQGRGIEIFNDIEELVAFIHSRPQYTCCVVQKYIERPLLFKQRKFDIRVWSLFTHRNEVFFYKHGYLRTSSDDYNLTNGNNYVHLTNNCLQKFGDNYGVHEEGNTVGFKVLQQFLDDNFPEHKISVEEHFIPRMKDLIIDSFNATKHQLNPNRRKHCFELLGYDFLIDEDFRLWLIEINTNPYFGVPNSFIAGVLPKMMDDLLDIVVDPIYAPQTKPESLNRPNEFELIYCEGNSPYSEKHVNQRRPYGVSVYPVPDLAQQVGPKAPRVIFQSQSLQQDLRYLKQFKISNLQLSTLSFKKKDTSPEKVAEVSKSNTRSKSMVPNRVFNFQNNNQQPTQHADRNSRSKSIHKNYTNIGNLTTLVPPTIQQSTTVRASSANRQKALHLRSTITSAFKQQESLMIKCKTPKTSKHTLKLGKTTLSSAQMNSPPKLMNNTQRSTPRQGGWLSQHNEQVRSRVTQRKSSKSDIMNNSFKHNNNTTKETSSIEQCSNQSSQDKFLFKKRERSMEVREIQSAHQFEQVFIAVIDVLILEKDDCDKMQFTFKMDYLVRFSEKLQVKQTLAKTKQLEILLKLYTSKENKVQKALNQIFLNLTCLHDLKKIQNLDTDQSSPLQGTQVVKQQLFTKALNNGLLLYVLSNNLNNIQVSQKLSTNEINVMIGQLTNQMRNVQANDTFKLDIDRIEQLTSDRYKAIHTDPDHNEDYNPITELSDNISQPLISQRPVERLDLSCDSPQQSAILYKSTSKRSQRLMEKELRSNQESFKNSVCPSPRQPVQSENSLQSLVLSMIGDQSRLILLNKLQIALEEKKIVKGELVVLVDTYYVQNSIDKPKQKIQSPFKKQSKQVSPQNIKSEISLLSNSKTPQQKIARLNSDYLVKHTPPKDIKTQHKPSVLSNFLTTNLTNRNQTAQKLRLNQQFTMINTSHSSVNKFQQLEQVSAQSSKYQPVLRNKIQPAIAKSTTLIAEERYPPKSNSKAATYSTYMQQSQIKQRAKSRATISRATNQELIVSKRSKNEIQQKNDEILQNINQKISDIQQNLNLLSNSTLKRKQEQVIVDQLNLQSFDSNHSSTGQLRIVEPQEQINDYDSSNVNFLSSAETYPNKQIIDLNQQTSTLHLSSTPLANFQKRENINQTKSVKQSTYFGASRSRKSSIIELTQSVIKRTVDRPQSSFVSHTPIAGNGHQRIVMQQEKKEIIRKPMKSKQRLSLAPK